ncbi:helix-turn-helix domain-containing protein [Streptomyces yerevanensis]|uniref:helix-turn-helix domain-containing protein n=1 Tax=Streptomyces yerevanensis TaxID=66378 RepID=UPI001FE0E782|nr:helix-turn-helix domain-containing protein [Streptomyces yerevanensis]
MREDWVRAPISREDLRARVAALRARSFPYTRPRVDLNGSLKYRDRLISVSPVESALLEILTAGFRKLSTRNELVECLVEQRACSSRNALDLHIMRIRRRIRPLGLVIRTAWGRGYILEPNDGPAGED